MASNTVFNLKGHYVGQKYIKGNLIRSDSTYQRGLNQAKVNRIVKEWNYDIFNPPKVSQRKDGTFWVFDGGHSVSAHKIHEGEEAPILCNVYTGLTWEDEKNLFIAQRGIHSDPTTLDKLRALYNGEDPEVRGMVSACAHCGVRVTFENSKMNGKTRYACNCVAALYEAYKALTPSLFFRMMTLVSKAWEGDPASYQAGFIKGMKRLYIVTGGSFNDKEMIKSLSKYSPEYFIREARDMSGSLDVKFSKLFIRTYNIKRRTQRIEIEEGAS